MYLKVGKFYKRKTKQYHESNIVVIMKNCFYETNFLWDNFTFSCSTIA